jgi:hypothetical protein
VDVAEYTVGRDRFSDALASLKWTTPDNFTAKLNYLADLSAIDAVVTLK